MLVEADGDGAEVLEPVDAALDDVAALVGLCIEVRRSAASAPTSQAMTPRVTPLRADAADAALLQRPARGGRAVGPVHPQHRGPLARTPSTQARHPDRIEHRQHVSHVGTLPGRHHQPQGTGAAVAAQVDLGSQPATRVPKPLVVRIPPFSARAAWCRAPVALSGS